MAGVADHHDVGIGGGGQRRDRAGGPGRQHVGHLLSAGRLRHKTPATQPVDRGAVPGRSPVTAFGKQDEGVVGCEAGSQVRHGSGRRFAAPTDEAAPEPGQQDVDGRVQAQPFGHHDPREAPVAAHQQVHKHERSPRTGVPTEHDHRVRAGQVVAVGGFGDRLVDLQPEPEREAGQADERAEEPAEHREMQLLRPGSLRTSDETDPQAQAGQQARCLARQVGDAEQPGPRQPPPHRPLSDKHQDGRGQRVPDQDHREQDQGEDGEQRHQRCQEQPS